MEYFDKFIELVKSLDAMFAALALCVPLFLQWRVRAVALAAEINQRRKEGLLSLVPLIVRRGHERFAEYRVFRDKTYPEKKKYLEDLIVAAHARRNNESAVTKDEVQMVLAEAETYWKSNKMNLKEELAADPSNVLPPPEDPAGEVVVSNWVAPADLKPEPEPDLLAGDRGAEGNPSPPPAE